MADPADEKPPDRRLGPIARLFLKLGFTAFGGPAAHVALMEDEVVRRRGWMSRGQFLDTVSAVNFIPGPNSTELAIHIGQTRAGLPGLVTAGACFILPAMLIVLPIAWAYTTHGPHGANPAAARHVADALIGIKAATVAIVANALVRFAGTGVKDAFTAALATLALACSVLAAVYTVPQSELIILATAATAGAIYYRNRITHTDAQQSAATQRVADAHEIPRDTNQNPPPTSPTRHLPLLLAPALAATPFWAQTLQMCLFFLKVGATLFGSGYVLASYLDTGLVEHHRWLTRQELLDAIAVGQVTPGPLLTAATFIGYLLGHRNFGGGVPGGIVGGALATLAIFLPSFLFIAGLGHLLPRLRRNRFARGALDGMNAAVVALIATVTVWFAKAALFRDGTCAVDWLAASVCGGSLVVLLTTRPNATWLIVVGAGIGVVRGFV
ncbi:MAG TPA: chromate efflux transporter [Tepidisphaeraceae bacterium]|nr:chromate efflux transporter [Tepidisphaeraceae bacterium]